MECKYLYLFFALCLFLSGCGAGDITETSESYTLSNMTITAQSDTVMEIQQISSSGGLIALRNTGEKIIGYGESYAIEKNINGNWYSLNIRKSENEEIEFSWPDILYTLESGEETTLELQWDSLYGFLSEGRYRLVKNISYPDYAGGKENVTIAVCFDIAPADDLPAGN